jgi:hypothetical protein
LTAVIYWILHLGKVNGAKGSMDRDVDGRRGVAIARYLAGREVLRPGGDGLPYAVLAGFDAPIFSNYRVSLEEAGISG